MSLEHMDVTAEGAVAPEVGTLALEMHHLSGDSLDPVAVQAGCRTVSEILSRVGDKWSILIVMILASGPRRFNELKRLVDSISQRMLTLTLRNLERDGLVLRTVTPSIPPRVDYALTPLGHSLRVPVSALGAWVMAHIDTIKDARGRFDAERDERDALDRLG
ncbi:MAG: helix-turn-helix domain-containing protein [Sphingobium sp.]